MGGKGLRAREQEAAERRAGAAVCAAVRCVPLSRPHSRLPSPILARSRPPTRPPQVRYVFKPHFGELPPYLRQRKRELAAAAAAAAASQAPAAEAEAGTVLEGEALAELVRHMKLKWQAINEAYVRLPCVLDTPSKKRRKEVH